MLKVSGVFKEKNGNEIVFNDEVVHADRLIKLFGIEDYFKDPWMSFRLIGKRVFRDKKNPKIIKSSLGIRYPTDLRGTFNGSDMYIKYYTQKIEKSIPNSKGGGVVTNYLPHKLKRMNGLETKIELNVDKEVALFYFLNPCNELSPLTNMEVSKAYTYYNPAGEAKRELEFKKIRAKITNDIFEKPFSELKTKAFALGGNKTLSISNVDGMSEDVLRNAMSQKLEEHPAEFIKAWTGPMTENKYQPIIQEGLSLGIIQIKSTEYKKLCVWSHLSHDPGKFTDNNIATCEITENIQRFIENTMKQNPAKFEHLIFEIKKHKALNENPEIEMIADISASLKTGEDEFNKWLDSDARSFKIKDVLKYAYEKQILDIDRKENAVYLLDSNGGYEGEPIAVVKSVKTWLDDFTDILNKPDYKKKKGELKKNLLDRLKQ